jgi:hypothetical protein
MPITRSELHHLYSVKTGSAGNTTAGTMAGSLGKYVSTTHIADTPTILFPNVSGDDQAAGRIWYKCTFFKNTDLAITWETVRLYLPSQMDGGAAVAIGVDPTAASDHGSPSAQALEIANDSTAPAGVTFSAPTTRATGLDLGNIGPNQVKAVWWRQTALPTAFGDNDTWAWQIDGESRA